MLWKVDAASPLGRILIFFLLERSYKNSDRRGEASDGGRFGALERFECEGWGEQCAKCEISFALQFDYDYNT